MNNDISIFYIPFRYLHRVRLKSLPKIISWWFLMVLPTAFFYCMLAPSPLQVTNLVSYILLLLLVVIYYELGYMHNDTYATKREQQPTLRLSPEQTQYLYQHTPIIMAVRMAIVLILALIYGQINHWTSNILITLTGVFMLLPLFLFYNSVRGKKAVFCYPVLISWRYILFLLPFIGHGWWWTAVCLLLLSYPIAIGIERYSMPHYRFPFMQRFIPSESAKPRFRMVYYVTTTIVLLFICLGGKIPVIWLLPFVVLLIYRTLLCYKNVQYLLFLLVTTLWTALAFILPDFVDNPVSGIASLFTIAAYVVVLAGASFWLLLITTIQRHVAAIFLPVFALVGSAVAYFRVAFHTTITPIILEVTFQTNPAEAASVISWWLIAYILINLVIASLLVWWRMRIGRVSHGWIYAIIGLAGLLIYYNCNHRLHMSINQRYPYNIYASVKDYIQLHHTKQEVHTMSAVESIMPTNDSLAIIVVLGEAIRADHLSINGYPRSTMPRLSQRAHLINLGDVYSMHTHTSASLPHLLTPADSLHPEYAQTQESFIPYLHDAGFHTSWISNQDITTSYAHIAYSTDTCIFPNSGKSVYVFDTWTDLDLIQPIQSLVTSPGKHLCIVHSIGAHWYYNNHVATEHISSFLPATTNRVVTQNDSTAIVNSYDNCVLTMDVFVDSLCTILSGKEAILIYQSDHGESLGEKGNWLHAGGAEETKHPAGFIWYSDAYQTHYPEMVHHIDSLSRTSLSTDYLFPLVLHTAGIQIDNPSNYDQH